MSPNNGRRPDRQRTRELLESYHKHGDSGARKLVIEEQMPLAEFLAGKFRGRGEPIEDLVQVASIGLIKAVDRFDIDRQTEFSTYATPNIMGEIKRHFRDKGWAMRVPRSMQEMRQAVKDEIHKQTVKTGKSPTIRELAETLGADEEKVAEALALGRAYNTASLDAPANPDDPEGDTVGELQADESALVEGMEDRMLLESAMGKLEEQEQQILKLRFNEGKTQIEIARDIGVSQMHVSRLLRRAIAELHEEIGRVENHH